MNDTPVMIDLFCGVGGASRGYADAGFAMYGVDRAPQPRYPYPFHRGDAVLAMAQLIAGHGVKFTHPDGRVEVQHLDDVDAWHGSPPCQASSALTKANRTRDGWSDTHVDLIPVTRALFELTGRPSVIENVQGAQMRRDLTLCGEMFGLDVLRHRYFELGGWSATPPQHRAHRGRVAGWRHGVFYDGPYVAVYGDGGGKGSVVQWQAALGIDWTEDRLELREAIPPAYSRHVGQQLLDLVAGTKSR